jgi:hypothetical protein
VAKNKYLVKSFINDSDVEECLSWINTINHNQEGENHHVNEVAKMMNGSSYMFDISKTDLTKYVTSEQSGNNLTNQDVPKFIHDLVLRISKKLNIPSDNVFLQVIDMNKGGTIKPHYDVSVQGFINYKCNVSVISEDYSINIEEDVLNIQAKDLYSFEASLYKHWTTNPFSTRRVLLSFGYILPYSILNRSSNEPRVRLSNRIQKYFQSNLV